MSGPIGTNSTSYFVHAICMTVEHFEITYLKGSVRKQI